MESIPKKGYFAKELALKTLFGDRAFQDLKLLLDPCCGIGIDKICTTPCGGGSNMCPVLTITNISIDCTDCASSFITLTAGNTGGAALCGVIQLQYSLPDVPVKIAISADTFCITGDTTVNIPIPLICEFLSITDEDISLEDTEIIAYQVSGVSSNLFSLTPSNVYCPRITLCSDDEDCLVVSCDGDDFFLSFEFTTTLLTGDVVVQITVDEEIPTWVDFDTITGFVNDVSFPATIDISSLNTGGGYRMRLVDANTGEVVSNIISFSKVCP